MISRAPCSVCGASVPVKIDGTTYVHSATQQRSDDPADGLDYARCAGSHTPPKAG